jgi:tetratricopeptide (TPR) repeat protein
MLVTSLLWSLIAMMSPHPQDGAAAGLLREANALLGARKYAEAVERYRRCSELAAKEGNRATQAEALAQIARCYSIEGKLDQGRPWLERAEKLGSTDDPQAWSCLLCVRGIFQRESGDKVKAKATFEEMYRYSVEKNLLGRAIDAIHHIAIVVPPDEQPAWALKGIDAAERLKDDSWLAVLWNNLGATYEDLKQYDKMVDAYLKAREYHHKSGTPLQEMIADWGVGHGYRLAGKLAEAETWLRKALPQALELQAKDRLPDNAEWVGWCKKDLGQTLIARGDKAKGLELLKEARPALVEAGIDKHWPEGFKDLENAIEKAR